MIVRDATAGDVAALARIAADAYAATFAGLLEPEALAACGPDFFAARFNAGWPATRVVGDPLAGFAKTTGAHLDMLFVDPAAQGRGLGAALLADSEARGIASLECFQDNMRARRFYERHGWRLAEAYERAFHGRGRAFVLYRKP